MDIVGLLTKTRKVAMKGYGTTIENFIESLDKNEPLPDLLQEKLDSIKDNPIEEKELYDKLNSFDNEVDKIDIVEDILENPDEFTAKELAVFVNEVDKKISSLQNKDGSFKSTANTANAKLLTRAGYKEIIGILSTDGQITATVRQQIEAQPKAFELSGLKKEDLTEWEAQLVSQMMINSALDTWMHSTGKR